MSTAKQIKRPKIPRRFEELVKVVPARAISGEGQHQQTVEMIDRLMAGGKLTKDQSDYLETLVQLVQAYETAHHAIDVADITGLESLKHLMAENSMSASDLAQLLGVHSSMGSKILKGDRSLTVEHVKKLAARFKVAPGLFIE